MHVNLHEYEIISSISTDTQTWPPRKGLELKAFTQRSEVGVALRDESDYC